MALVNRRIGIRNGDEQIHHTTIIGPMARLRGVLFGFEDYDNPRVARLRREYKIDRAVPGGKSEFRRILKLRRWVATRWPINNAQDAFICLRNLNEIDWTPGVPAMQLERTKPGLLAVRIVSATPNLAAYLARQNMGSWRAVQRRIHLATGDNRLDVPARNLFGVHGPVVTAKVVYR
jgi:hypothetical protein